jgi:acetylornithine deacetylase/succinyl-diaminopimelate desuccinylase-like protein
MFDKIKSIAEQQSIREVARDLLVELCEIDTTPNADVSVMRRAESACFEILERELGQISLEGLACERRAIDPAISEHPDFSLLHFTKTPERPEGLPATEVYKDRGNLVCTVPGFRTEDGTSLALNAHIDVVAPYVSPSVKDGTAFGRGACDDKGPVVGMVAALKIVDQYLRETGQRLRGNVVSMFVIEEETGGNGSLALATDAELKKHYDAILVEECCDNNIHPANRGAVWYKTALAGEGLNLFELAMFVVEEMEKEGRSIRTESFHPLFPQRPVQTCHGMIGHVGEHPSRICGELGFTVTFPDAPGEAAERLLRDCIDFALEEYVGRYGDKTQVNDPQTGMPKVAKHLDITAAGETVTLDVHGSTGHMGSIFENDGAITKMSYLVRALVRSRKALEEAAGGTVRIDLKDAAYGDELVLEGGQGFVPTHDITEVMERMARSVERGAESYLRLLEDARAGADVATTTYDKLHNAAFDGDPESQAMRNAIAAAKDAGIWRDQPVTGWTVSCDARLFARAWPEMPVLTSGAGKLAHAHSDEEQLDLDALETSALFLAAFILRHVGTCKAG